MVCEGCGRLLFPKYGDGDRLCAGCREERQETLPSAIEPKPREAWQPVRGRIGGTEFRSPFERDVRLAHMQPEPCPTCAAYIAAGL